MKKYFGETKHIRVDNKKSKQDDYKWFTLQDGDVVPEEVESLVFGKKEKAKEKVEDKPKVKKGILNRIKDVAEDLLDDGKRNYSNDPNKKSPGRKPKKKGGKK